MTLLFKKLWKFVTSIFRKSKPVSLESLRKEVELIKEAQVYLVQFYQLELKKSTDQYKAMSKIANLNNTKFDEINKLLNQHADTINSFLLNYKEHILNPSAHNSQSEVEDTPKAKIREDN
jgi:hypothetical protein